jgi:hypothetical protein
VYNRIDAIKIAKILLDKKITLPNIDGFRMDEKRISFNLKEFEQFLNTKIKPRDDDFGRKYRIDKETGAIYWCYPIEKQTELKGTITSDKEKISVLPKRNKIEIALIDFSNLIYNEYGGMTLDFATIFNTLKGIVNNLLDK